MIALMEYITEKVVGALLLEKEEKLRKKKVLLHV